MLIFFNQLKFLYVAITRARKNLWIADCSDKGEPMKVSVHHEHRPLLLTRIIRTFGLPKSRYRYADLTTTSLSWL